MMNTSTQLHVVLGASGGVGGAVVRALLAQHKQVRGVTRSVKPITRRRRNGRGGFANLDQARSACQDASVVYFARILPIRAGRRIFPPC